MIGTNQAGCVGGWIIGDGGTNALGTAEDKTRKRGHMQGKGDSLSARDILGAGGAIHGQVIRGDGGIPDGEGGRIHVVVIPPLHITPLSGIIKSRGA